MMMLRQTSPRKKRVKSPKLSQQQPVRDFWLALGNSFQAIARRSAAVTCVYPKASMKRQ